MANSLFDSVKEMVTPGMKQTLATRLGESPQTVDTGLSTAIAAVLSAIAARAGDTTFLNQFSNFVGNANNQNVLGAVSSLAATGLNGAAGELIDRFQGLVFGEQKEQAVNFVARRAGTGQPSANALFSMAVALVLAYFNKQHSIASPNILTLSNQLQGERASLERWVPANYLNLPAKQIQPHPSLSTVELGDGPGPGKGAMWLVSIGIVSAILMAWTVYRSTNTPNLRAQPVTNAATTAAVNSANVVADAVNTASATAGIISKTKLPDGTELSIPKLGPEAQLIDLLNDKDRAPNRTTAVDLDHVMFDPDNATIQPDSEEQLRNVAAIMKAYPNMKARIDGYTDDAGDKKSNLKLSDQRAKAVADDLEKQGVPASRISAKGYGDAHPEEENTTEAGRQKNRRISLQVLQK
ncbi:MAG TPA: OmpA family protein [Candidatus Acidoferrum sp.]